VARTRFFDDQVLVSIARGVRQVVICGAGYDDRALRFRTTGVRFFELDHPATQAHKAGQLRVMGAQTAELTLAAADFRTAEVATVLSTCGHDPNKPSLFICEGLLVYLDQRTCTRLLAGLRSRAAEGSRLAASLAVHRNGLSSEQVVAAANARRRTGRDEPWRTVLPLEAHLALLERCGWHVERATDAAELEADAVPGRAQLITAAPLRSQPEGR
jgi:methyltransferase (TIGR00027 family)